jgi:ubiquinone/menaquinone biosynthesis C-methylase UbiE
MDDPLASQQMQTIDQQKVVVKDFQCSGYILDIGGGGEGIIGVLKGEKVIAVDKRKEELEEAPEGPLKIVMDVKDLQFLDNTFETVTSFFTLMYITKKDHKKVFEEVLRVLKPQGKFLIWDVIIPSQDDSSKEWFVIPLTAVVHGKEIQTGYGVTWKDRKQDMTYYEGLAKEIGFNVAEKIVNDQNFYLHLTK